MEGRGPAIRFGARGLARAHNPPPHSSSLHVPTFAAALSPLDAPLVSG